LSSVDKDIIRTRGLARILRQHVPVAAVSQDSTFIQGHENQLEKLLADASGVL
jgi:hypothetical protein